MLHFCRIDIFSTCSEIYYFMSRQGEPGASTKAFKLCGNCCYQVEVSVATCPNCEERFRMREYRKSVKKPAKPASEQDRDPEMTLESGPEPDSH